MGSDSFEYYFESRLGFIDVSSGHVFLTKQENLKECKWLPDYISPVMFAKNKPFNQAFLRRAQRVVNSAKETNDFFSMLGEIN